MKQEKGMTIIATMLTIIVLVILGTLTVHLLIGDTGLLWSLEEVGNVYEEEPKQEVKQNKLLQNATNTIQDPMENFIKELGN